jgi:hypothetical protein
VLEGTADQGKPVGEGKTEVQNGLEDRVSGDGQEQEVEVEPERELGLEMNEGRSTHLAVREEMKAENRHKVLARLHSHDQDGSQP